MVRHLKNLLYIPALLASAMAMAGEVADLKPYIRKAASVSCKSLGKRVPLLVYDKDGKTPKAGAPVIVYVMNHAAKRIGLESDHDILSDYIAQGCIVITLDFENNPRALSPAFDWDLYAVLRSVYSTKSAPILKGTGLVPQKDQCWFLPAGYRLVRDLVYFDLEKHGRSDTKDRILKVYNEYIVPTFKRKPATRISDVTGKNGEPLDFKLRMDLVYPSKSRERVPLVYWNGTKAVRAMVLPRRPHFIGFTMRGYAYAHIAHCYNPLVYLYGHFPRYTLNYVNGIAASAASIRFLRKHASTYGINPDFIGGVGHSKGAHGITFLSDPKRTIRAKVAHLFPEQPWLGFSSKINVAYHSMGNGTRETYWVNERYVPTLIACGRRDKGHWKAWPKVQNTYRKYDLNHLALGMLDLGHDIPYGQDPHLGIDRYVVMHDFFDRYLRPNLPPTVLYITPANRKTDVYKDDSIAVHFAPDMDPRTVAPGVRVERLRDGKPVTGDWNAYGQNSRFVFTPDAPLAKDESYKVTVGRSVKNRRGTPLAKAVSSVFTVRMPQSIFSDDLSRAPCRWTGKDGAKATPVKGALTLDMAGVSGPTINTKEYSNVRVTYDIDLSGLARGQAFVSEWFDGEFWFVMERIAAAPNVARTRDVRLPPGTWHNPALKLRFKTAGKNGKGTAMIGNIMVRGMKD